MMCATVTTQQSSSILSFMTAIAATQDFGDVIRHMLWKPAATLRAPVSAFEEDGVQFRAESLTQIAKLEADLDAWILDGVTVKRNLWDGFRAGEESQVGAQIIGTFIEAYETNALAEAKDIARMQKSFQRDQKAAGRISTTAARVLKEVDEQLLAYLQRAVAARLDYALFMRAHRSELDPASRGGPTFDDPSELEKYLLAVAAE